MQPLQNPRDKAANAENLPKCIGRSRSARNPIAPSLQQRRSKGARHDHLSHRVSQTLGAEVGKSHRADSHRHRHRATTARSQRRRDDEVEDEEETPKFSPSGRWRGRAAGGRRGRCAGIVGFSPGGSADLHARLIAQWLSKRLGQQFIIENRRGQAPILPCKRQSIHSRTATGGGGDIDYKARRAWRGYGVAYSGPLK